MRPDYRIFLTFVNTKFKSEFPYKLVNYQQVNFIFESILLSSNMVIDQKRESQLSENLNLVENIAT